MVQGSNDRSRYDSGISVGSGKDLSDSLIYPEVEVTGFLKGFAIWSGV